MVFVHGDSDQSERGFRLSCDRCHIRLTRMTALVSFLALGVFASALPVSPSVLLRRTVQDFGEVLPVVGQSKLIGKTSPGATIRFGIALRSRDSSGLQAFCDRQAGAGSPSREFLTPQQVGERFGASKDDQATVVKYLESYGLAVTLVADNRMSVLAEGSASQIELAFGTDLREFHGLNPDASGEYDFRANVTPLSLPINVANAVLSVSGIETYTRPKALSTTTTLTPALAQGLYKMQPVMTAGFHGEGRNLGISSFDGFSLTNATRFISTYGLPYPAAGAGKNITVKQCGVGMQNNYQMGEGDLDYQMMLAMAPLANITIYDGSDLYYVLAQEAQDNKSDVISESYSWKLSDSGAQACHQLHLSMTAQGITYLAASGDTGTKIEPYNYPDCDPEVLIVGGTAATVNSTTGARAAEVAWSLDSTGHGGGGGWSTNTAAFNTSPAYQKAIRKLAPAGVTQRLFPDVALHAAGADSKTFAYYFFFKGGKVSADGTSASSPLFAAGLATVEQRLFQYSGTTPAGGRWRLGRLQDLIYAQNGRGDIWYDITSGNIGTLQDGKTPGTATRGWDFATGWGSVSFDGLFRSFSTGRY